MPKAKQKELLIQKPQQVRALASPVRQSIVNALKRLGRASIRDIAGELGRVPATLYYHVKQLEQAKLVQEVEVRETARRPEVVYALVADRLRLKRHAGSKAWERELQRLVRSHMRSMERALLRNLIGVEQNTTGNAPLSQFRSQRARINKADRRALQTRLEELMDFLEKAAERAGPKDPVLSLLIAHAPTDGAGED